MASSFLGKMRSLEFLVARDDMNAAGLGNLPSALLRPGGGLVDRHCYRALWLDAPLCGSGQACSRRKTGLGEDAGRRLRWKHEAKGEEDMTSSTQPPGPCVHH